MAKFLPFVVERSTPVHIFQTLVSRSKGMNDVLVASIFYLLLEKGINEVRSAASEFPESDTGSLYEKLLVKYPSYRIPTDDYAKMQTMLEYVTHSETFMSHIDVELHEFAMEEILSFFTVLLLHKKINDYTHLNFKALVNGEAERILEDLPATNLFADDCPQVSFTDITELAAYIVWHSIIAPSDDGHPGPVTAVYGKLAADAPPWKPKPKSEKDYWEAV